MRGDLFLTDGTTRINLLSGIDGYYLDNWNPSIAPAKNVTSESPLSDGSHLVLSRWANATETLNFKVGRFTQNDVIHDTQDLRRLLEAAKQYFIGGSDIPVWLEARGNCETNTRYAVICDYQTSNDSDPYHKPFDLDNPVMTPWTLIVERQHWRHMPPGQSECVELSATQDYYDEQQGDYEPAESADDAHINDGGGGSISLNAVNLIMGDGGGGAIYHAGVRFRTVTIPNAAIILYAWVDFEAAQNDANDTCNITIAADDVDNSAIFSTYADFTGRTRTAATAAWNAIAHWVAGTHYQTPNIASSVQEVVNRVGWVNGNNLSIIFDNNVSTAGAIRRPASWDTDVGRHIPVLYVWWFDATTRTFGRTATCANEVYVANKHNIAQLTHVFYDDGGVFSANLIGAGLPFDFLPAVPAVNDAVYFGISTTASDSGPFCSLVFDILDAQNDLTTVTWQYWNGAWAGLVGAGLQDNTNADGLMTGDAFDTTGVNSVAWLQPSGWVTTAVNGVTGYWVRALVGAIGGAPDAPSQQNRDIYTVVTPYVDTTAVNVIGDIQALAKQFVHAEGYPSVGRIFAGLRSYDRGSLFTPYINLADEQNQTGVTIAANAVPGAAFANDVTSPTGRVINWTTAGAAGLDWIASIDLSTSLATHYIGLYRVFLRMDIVAGTPANVYFYLTAGLHSSSDLVWRSEAKRPRNNAVIYLDFGKIQFPIIQHDTGQAYYQPGLRIYGETTSAININLYDLILLPCDECFVETSALPNIITGIPAVISLLLNNGTELRRATIDSTIPRRFIKTFVDDKITNTTTATWRNNANISLIFQPNERQRWWYLNEENFVQYPNPITQIEALTSVQSWEVSRYLSMRGAR